ncbi:CUGBP Elav-like family member 4 [Momordica charantia]|uniref:CUGBP Elav-like family member 4 n=1 Tax=Momordica charantia TaxID=3673 RepID=A0A6J1DSB0_MOMCH|nr:CUGBP Elav-like family member 4 [Momordica charantia]
MRSEEADEYLVAGVKKLAEAAAAEEGALSIITPVTKRRIGVNSDHHVRKPVPKFPWSSLFPPLLRSRCSSSIACSNAGRVNFPSVIPISAKLERHRPSSSAPWPSDDHRPNFNHQFDPYVQFPNHHPGPPFCQPNYPPQYPHRPPPPPPHQHPPPYQNQHQHQHPPPQPHHHQPQQNNWNQPEFHNHQPEYRHQPHFNGEANEGFGNGGLRPNCGNQNANLGRKRPRNYSNRTVPSDHAEAVKLYVAQVPRTGTEEAIRPLFEVHGDIVEIVILRDKITGQQQGSCFVKYATSIEADRAIGALDNQFTFPGEMAPINVKYADGERERLGVLEKLYVGSLNKNTTKREIEEVFSPYGFVEDIYIMRDELKQSRGCAFVKYARREMAMAAIKALNGNYTIRGCDQPLIVRLADPKKSRVGEQRSNSMSGSPNFGHHPQPFRPEPPLGAPAGGCFPNNLYPPQQNSASLGPAKNASQVASNAPLAPNTIQKAHPPIQEPSSSFAHIPSQPMRTTQQVCQPPTQPDFSKMQNQVYCQQQPRKDSYQQQNSQVNENTPPTAHGLQTFSGVPNSPLVRPCSRVEVSLECDWSEHTCPDGFKYYYNCVTCESSWEKPEEFALFEQQLKQEKLQKQNHQLHSSLPISSPEVLPHPNVFSQKLEVQSSSAVRELDCMRLQSKASPVVSPACV